MRGINHILEGWYERDWRWKNFECWNPRKRQLWHVLVCVKDNTRIESSKITYTHFEVEHMIFMTPQVLQTMYNWFILACEKFQNDRLTGTEEKWTFQFLADFALLMAQNASFGNRGFWPVEKRERSRVWRRIGVKSSNKLRFQCLCVLYTDWHT